MKRAVACIFMGLCISTLLAAPQTPTHQDLEVSLKAADALFKQSPQKAAAAYAQLIKTLPKSQEAFRPLLIMRQAYATPPAQRAAVLKQLDALRYVPEHHALAAKEMIEQDKTGAHPGLKRTPIPALPKVDVTIAVSPKDPIKDLTTALAKARQAKAAGKSVEIVLAPGTYLQKTTLTLSNADNGLIIRSQDPKQPAVITGGVTLKTWTKTSDKVALELLPAKTRDAVRVCDLKAHGVESLGELRFGGVWSRAWAAAPVTDAPSVTTPELFHKKKAQRMATWPNKGYTKLPVHEIPKQANPKFLRWNKEPELWFHGYWKNTWAESYHKLDRVEPNGNILFAPPQHTWGYENRNGRVVNALTELDQPGEWHLDSKKGLIHYLPPKDFDPEQCELSAYGSFLIATDCSNLQLRDLKLTLFRGDTVLLTKCEQAVLTHLDVRDCSGDALDINGGKRHLVHSCNITSTGRGGIRLTTGDWTMLVPGHSIIENCRISHCSRINRTYTPAVQLFGMGAKVRYNEFSDIPSSAVNQAANDVLFELNVLRRCVYESGDQGAIDTHGNPLRRGNIIRWNYFEDIFGEHGPAAVRLDDPISGFMVNENVFYKGGGGSFGALQINKGTDNYFEGNIIMDWASATSGRTAIGEKWTEKLTTHRATQKNLNATDWTTPAWQKKYPMVRDLMNGDDNTNYVLDNQKLGQGQWRGIKGGTAFANRDGDKAFRATSLKSFTSVLVPWHPIPIDHIGPYTK